MNHRSFLDYSKDIAAGKAPFALSPKQVLAKQYADVIYINGTILTIDSHNSQAEALAVAEEYIVAVGDKKDVLNLQGAQTKIVDLQGRTLLPGFIDGHGHFPESATLPFLVNCGGAPFGMVNNIPDMIEALKKGSEKNMFGDWIIGYNYNNMDLEEGRHPTKHDLDKVSSTRPVFIHHLTGHTCVANSVALKIAGITAETTSPGGAKVRLGADGQPDGLLEGMGAPAFVLKHAPAYSEEVLEQIVKSASAEYSAVGITTAQNGGFPNYDETFLRMADKGTLDTRVVIWPSARDATKLSVYGDFRSGDLIHPSGKITMGAAKFWSDGSPTGYTAYFSEPYYKIPKEKPEGYRGFAAFDPEDLKERVLKLHNDGWQLAIHANGDQAIEDVLNAYESISRANIQANHQANSRANVRANNQANSRADTRHIIVHSQFAREDQVDRMVQLKVYPTFFTNHTWFWGDTHLHFTVGPERAARLSPTKDALDRGLLFSLHSDAPLTPISPLLQIFTSVTRLTASGYVLGPDQRISVTEALRAVTINAAYLHKEEATKGSLEVGKVADFVILEQNPLSVDPEILKDIKVAETIIGGKTVYQA